MAKSEYRKISIPNVSFQTLVICGVRYALGRRTYMPAEISEIIRFNIKHIDDSTLRIVKRDIETHGDINNDSMGLYGDACDYITWRCLYNFLSVEYDNRGLKDLF